MGPKRGQHTPAGGGPVCCRQSLVPFDFGFDVALYEMKRPVGISSYAIYVGIPG